jgi:hypothetical protein
MPKQMSKLKKLVSIGCFALAGLSAGCGGGSTAEAPKSVEQQAEMARGHKPTKEEYDRAMSKVHIRMSPPETPQGQGVTR